jgi:hypothetical protein
VPGALSWLAAAISRKWEPQLCLSLSAGRVLHVEHVSADTDGGLVGTINSSADVEECRCKALIPGNHATLWTA